MKTKVIVFTLLFIGFSKCYSFDLDEFLEDSTSDSGKLESLYVTNSEKLDGLDSVVFYLSSTEPDTLLIDQFMIFSDEIGLNNGAVYIPLNKAASIASAEQDAPYQFKSKSTCRFIYSGDNAIILEIKKNKNPPDCLYFSLNDNGAWLSEVLGAIISYLKNTTTAELRKLGKLEIENKILNEVTTGIEGLDDNKSLIYKQFSAIVELIKNSL